MEVYFLDVGQGTSQVLLLGGRKAFVVDCGGADTTLPRFLSTLRIDRLVGVAVSHSDTDHSGAADSLLTDFEGRIDTIFVMQDHKFLDTPFWRRIAAQLRDGTLRNDQLCRLENGNEPKMMYRDPAQNLDIKLFSPNAAQNLVAQASERANSTSAIVVLQVGAHRIVFPGDSDIAQWRLIRQHHGSPLTCDVLAVPHHGGLVGGQVNANDLKLLYGDYLEPRVAIVSVGTSNTHAHPLPEVISALTRYGSAVVCTQITKKCCDRLESLRPAVLQPLQHVGKSRPIGDFTATGNSRNVACAGTVLVRIDRQRVEVERLAEHQDAVDRLTQTAAGGPLPLCRR